MELCINRTYEGRALTDVHTMYDWLFWDIELKHNYDLSAELVKPTIWHDNHEFKTACRYCADINQSEILLDFCNDFAKLKNQLIELAAGYECFTYRWWKDIDYYLPKMNIDVGINKDTVGFSMQPHLDNSHVVVQTIINLVDNPSATEIYEFNDTTPKYQMSTDVNKGVTFFNNPGAVHGIRNITRDRYTLYAAVTYP